MKCSGVDVPTQVGETNHAYHIKEYSCPQPQIHGWHIINSKRMGKKLKL